MRVRMKPARKSPSGRLTVSPSGGLNEVSCEHKHGQRPRYEARAAVTTEWSVWRKALAQGRLKGAVVLALWSEPTGTKWNEGGTPYNCVACRRMHSLVRWAKNSITEPSLFYYTLLKGKTISKRSVQKNSIESTFSWKPSYADMNKELV